jgi:alkylation response protein AidB-like acyl-CoA dehydrogenase
MTSNREDGPVTQAPIKPPVYDRNEDAIARAHQLAPGLRARVSNAEGLRRLPDETVQELVESGLLLLLVPRSMGGSELNYDAVLDVTAILGEACSSTGWVYSLWTAHLWMIAQFPEHIQRQVFEGGRPLVSSCVNTVGKPVRVEGGYRWTGKGFFSSGSDHSTWLTPAMEAPNDDGTVERRWFLIPRSEYTIVDDWYTMGLKGTGSKTVVVDDVFIPDERALRVKEMSVGGAPGASIHPGVLYQAGFEFVFSLPVGMPALGPARAFLKAFQERIKARINGDNPVLAREAMHTLPRLAQAAAEIDAAHSVLMQSVRQYCFAPATEFGDLDRVKCRRDTSFAAQLCRRAVNDLFESSGGSSLFESSDMQRLWRDANAASAHHGLMWDIRGTEFARVLMGLPAAEQGPVTTYAQAGHTTPPDLSQVGVKLQQVAAASSGGSAQGADPTQRQGSTS